MVGDLLTWAFNACPHNPQPLLLLLLDLFQEELQSKTAGDGSRGSVPEPRSDGKGQDALTWLLRTSGQPRVEAP